MKLKFPKTIKVGSEVFEVRLDKKNVDAEFSFAFQGKPAFIRIGIEDIKVSKIAVLERIIHELKEIIQVTMDIVNIHSFAVYLQVFLMNLLYEEDREEN